VFLPRIVHLFTRSTERQRDERLSGALRRPLALLVVTVASFIALRSLSYLDAHRVTVERVWGAAILVLLIWLSQRLVSALLFRVGEGREGAGAAPLGHITPLAKRAVNVLIVVVGILLVLAQLGIAISPLLAGLGITGLAVALALQPLLTNLFAGSYVISDASIIEGDYVSVRGGPDGWVIDVGWRATRMRTLDGELVIVPNATLASSIVTNHGAEEPQDISLVYAIPYGHDLDRVEDVANEVLRGVIQERDEAVKDFRPRVQFQRLGDARIECLLLVRSRSRIEAPELMHALIKRVHARFQAEGFNPE
jgi:small-conductance mechanosensitive channel